MSTKNLTACFIAKVERMLLVFLRVNVSVHPDFLHLEGAEQRIARGMENFAATPFLENKRA